MIKWNKKFEYPASIRSSVEGKRHYEITGQKLPSVTTILSATQSAEKKKKLEEWKQRVGTQQADRTRVHCRASHGTHVTNPICLLGTYPLLPLF